MAQRAEIDPRLQNLFTKRDTLQKEIDVAHQTYMEPEFIDTLPPKIKLCILISKHIDMKNELKQSTREQLDSPYTPRPLQQIQEASNAISHTITELHSELYVKNIFVSVDEYKNALWIAKGDWDELKNKYKSSDHKWKIEVSKNLTEKKGKVEIFNFLLSDSLENDIYKLAEAEKKRKIPPNP